MGDGRLSRSLVTGAAVASLVLAAAAYALGHDDGRDAATADLLSLGFVSVVTTPPDEQNATGCVRVVPESPQLPPDRLPICLPMYVQDGMAISRGDRVAGHLHRSLTDAGFGPSDAEDLMHFTVERLLD